MKQKLAKFNEIFSARRATVGQRAADARAEKNLPTGININTQRQGSWSSQTGAMVASWRWGEHRMSCSSQSGMA